MASSRSSSNGADWRDVAGNIVAFEAINAVRVSVVMGTVDTKGRADLELMLVATAQPYEGAVPTVLASVSVRCSATNLRTMEGALIHGLYMLDGKLARGEFIKTINE